MTAQGSRSCRRPHQSPHQIGRARLASTGRAPRERCSHQSPHLPERARAGVPDLGAEKVRTATRVSVADCHPARVMDRRFSTGSATFRSVRHPILGAEGSAPDSAPTPKVGVSWNGPHQSPHQIGHARSASVGLALAEMCPHQSPHLPERASSDAPDLGAEKVWTAKCVTVGDCHPGRDRDRRSSTGIATFF